MACTKLRCLQLVTCRVDSSSSWSTEFRQVSTERCCNCR